MNPDYIDIHTHSGNSNFTSIVNFIPGDNIAIQEGKLFSIGLHPWFIDKDNFKSMLLAVSQYAEYPRCAAIGETGLDKLSKTDFGLQKTVFEDHLLIARKVNKPVIIHCVRAYEELIKLKKLSGSEINWIVHGFNSKPVIAEMLVGAGMKLSFGKALRKSDSNASECLKIVPDDAIFLETDDSSLSIEEVYRFAALARGILTEGLKEIIRKNYNKTFQITDD